MITIGIRAEPSAVTFAIYNSDTTNEIVNVEEIKIPAAFDVADRLKYIRSNLLDVIREFRVESAGVRVTEPNADASTGIQIEGMIQSWHSPGRASSTARMTRCQVVQQRQRVPREPGDLFGFLLVWPQQIQDHVANPGSVKCPDPLGNHLRRAKSTVALRGFAEVHIPHQKRRLRAGDGKVASHPHPPSQVF
jgi:hypothetical protein